MHFAPQREMGPVLLPTPLSPAVGSRKNAYRLACLRLSVARRPGSIRICRPALAPVPDWCLGHQGVTRTSPVGPGGHSAGRSCLPGISSGSTCSKLHASPSTPGCNTPATDHILPRFHRSVPSSPEGSDFAFLHRDVLSPRRVRFGFRSTVSAGDPALRSVFALDVCRMRGWTESGKGASVHLSTFGANASGQGWISQRLIATCETNPRFLAGAARKSHLFGCLDYRSRCASRRSRRALSLMKPAASAWS